MSKKATYSSVHIIGLGGTGANVIQALIEGPRLERLLESEDFQIACLALDVADGDLATLQGAYKGVQAKLSEKGIPVERVWVKGMNIKFNTPDTLYEFMEKYNTYLMKDGIVTNNYRPWIDSSVSIPPLAGGVGRQRALSKAVYALNYYHYVELNSMLSVFKDRVLTSKSQPIVIVVFGLGGGTGSGMIYDFARHLRQKLGSSVPVVGLAVLPSSADDLLARGPAPYAALVEGEAVFNRELNDRVVKLFGEAYRNPFTAQFFLPLDPVYNNRNSLMSAKKELDDAIIDTLNIMMNFDLADLLSRVGSNNDFGANWVHSLAFLRIRYPVDQYVAYLNEYLRLTESIGSFLNTKKDAVQMISTILENRLAELKDLYRLHLISVNSYRPETFDDEVNDITHRAGKYDVELRKQMKGFEDFARFYSNKWASVFEAMSFGEDSVEYGVVEQVKSWMASINQLSKVYDELVKSVPNAVDEMEHSMTASKFLTASQMRMIRAYTGLVELVTSSSEAIQTYLKAKALADEVAIRYGKDQSKRGRRAAAIGDTELLPLFRALGYLLTRPETEAKSFEQFLPGIRVAKKNAEVRLKDSMAEMSSQERVLAQKVQERDRIKGELARVRVDISGKKKALQRNLESIENDIEGLSTQIEQMRKDNAKGQGELDNATQLEKNFEITASYRKSVNNIVNKSAELNRTMSEITSTGSYYERVVELSEAEQVKIMEKILKEEEASLRGNEILKEILDKDRFRSIVKSYMRVFSVSNYAGLVDKYRSDLIWVTVGIPSALWDQELQGALSSTLNVYSSVEASKSISLRQIPQMDPWTITFLVIMAKARIDQIEKFPSMKNDMDAVMKSEKVLFRSFLLEQGVQSVEDLANQLEGRRPGSQVEERKA